MHLLKNGNRPFHLGPFPLETLPRDDTLGALEISRPTLALTILFLSSSLPFAIARLAAHWAYLSSMNTIECEHRRM